MESQGWKGPGKFTLSFPMPRQNFSQLNPDKTFWKRKKKLQFTYSSWHFKMPSIANLNAMQLGLYCSMMNLQVNVTTC